MASTTFVDGVTLSDDEWFNHVNDITYEVLGDNTTPPSTAIGAMKNLFKKGADIASAATVNLATATGNYVDITGTTAILSLGTVSSGVPFWLKFEGILTLTHNATSLILPGAADITTADGDIGLFISEGSGNWRCVWFTKKTISAFLATHTSANLASAVTDETGSGALVFANTPTLITPVLGVATGTSFQGIVGNVTPAAGSFTTLSATGTSTLAAINASAAVNANLTTDATSITTGSLLTAGGLGVTKAAWIGGLMNVAGAATLQSNLIASSAGPHAIGGGVNPAMQLTLTGNFASAGTTEGFVLDSVLSPGVGGDASAMRITPTFNKSSSSTHGDFVSLLLNPPGVGAGVAGLTNATTLKITGAPSAGTNMRALWVAAGATKLDGALTYGGVTLSNAVTGTGNMVLSESPTLTAPALGTPASGVATNLTGTAASLTAGNVTTNANLTGPITSVGNATSVAAQTGTGSTFVMQASPILTTPNLGTPSAGVLTSCTGTAAGLTSGNVTTNANLTGGVTSVGNAATVITNANLTGGVTSVGNAATVITNANLTGHVTSTGNAAILGSFTLAQLNTAISDANVGLTLSTEQATTSGTSIDFTGIPSWVKRITVMFDGVSTNGTSIPIIQIGDSGGVENTAYTSTASYIATQTTFSTGFGLAQSQADTDTFFGAVTLTLQDASNTWVQTGLCTKVGTMQFSAGHKALSATLDRVRLTTVNGTDAFDAGSINIMYE